MNYKLIQDDNVKVKKISTFSSLKRLLSLITEERKNLIYAFIFILVNASLSLLGPYLIAHTIDTYVKVKDYHGIILYTFILLGVFVSAFFANYMQMRVMGSIGQRMLFKLRGVIFNKLQELPVDFFNQNKAGDLISRVNNDSDKINQFFSQYLMQFISNIFTILGSAVFLLTINFELGLAALAPAFVIWIFTYVTSTWIRKKNAANLKATGSLSAEIQESLNNYKVIIAYNRRDYFRKRFEEVNQLNYNTSMSAGMANNIFMPTYGLAANIGQLIVLGFGIYLIMIGNFTLGLLIGFLAYVNTFYTPLRHLAGLWTNFQQAMAGWDRISQILELQSNLEILESPLEKTENFVVFKDVSFSYPNGKEVLHHVNLNLKRGKTYAFVGPTGGGKTTTASLLARLYDATKGSVILDGKDIRSYQPDERTRKIGFILQEPFLFTGTVRDNILYGNWDLQNISNDDLITEINKAGLESLLERFDEGLETKIQTSGDGISLGQKQLIAFMRAVLRKPELIILDEATANIDTVTEQLLEEILKKLPENTTRVIIAHRLNTIENADEIYFVNSGKVTLAGSLNDAVDMLLHGKRIS